MSQPRELAARALARPRNGPGPLGEYFAGYGVMGLPFSSGHILGLRNFARSSIGPGYRSVWHRDPSGAWRFYSDVEPMQSCPRFFGCELEDAAVTPIDVQWTGPRSLRITMEHPALEWDVELTSSIPTRIMNAAGRLMPGPAWHNPRILAAMAKVAGPLMRVGTIGLAGDAPNGQRFFANPRQTWMVSNSHARLDGQDLGPPGPVHPQARLGDFWIPQRGVFAIGEAMFETLDPARHRGRPTRETP